MSFWSQLVRLQGAPAMIRGGDKATTSGSSGSVDLAPSILGAWAMT